MKPTRVFISYTHDSDEHNARVLNLAQQLRDDGLVSVIDRFINGHPVEGWPLWMERQIQRADFVLIVCSPSYHRRYKGEESVAHGLGGVWESILTRQALYEGQGKNRKFIPVFFAGASVEDVPGILRYQYSHYKLMERYPELLRYLASQPDVLPNPVRKLTSLEPLTGMGESPNEGDDQFSESVSSHMALVNRKVEYLTQEQFRAIWLLRYLRRVRISGCAGSGKTLVAAEKAIRLSRAGLTTLFLCHNPLLAEHVRNLTRGSGVRVEPFGSWVVQLAGVASAYDASRWTNYDEPDSQSLETAFDVLIEREARFDAVIVDEGQDFRDEWWAIVEASLANTDTGILYIFHDDRQALLPYRSTYPIKEPVIDLSRNCRNAGKIYDTMRYFHPEAPMPEPELKDRGKVLFLSYVPGSEKEIIEKAVRLILTAGYGEDFVLLLGGSLSVENFLLSGATISIPTIPSWQEAVRRQFNYSILRADPRGVMFPPEGEEWISEHLNQLSAEPVPNSDDIEVVRSIARRFTIDHAIRFRIDSHPQFRNAMRWVLTDGDLRLHRPHYASIWAAEIVMHFERGDWPVGIPLPKRLTLRPYDAQDNDKFVKMYNVSDFKGLESDVVILLMRGGSAMIEQQLYVGVSRARFLLAALLDRSVSSTLPQEWLT
jgi:hypothetical protein